LQANDNQEGEESNNQSKKLYFMAYEIAKEDPGKKKYIYENLEFWKYQPEINFEMLKIDLNNGTQPEDYKILKKFINMVKNSILTFKWSSLDIFF
jgi:hypothetical protein